jgi:hypothetical protein
VAQLIQIRGGSVYVISSLDSSLQDERAATLSRPPTEAVFARLLKRTLQAKRLAVTTKGESEMPDGEPADGFSGVVHPELTILWERSSAVGVPTAPKKSLSC